MTTNFLIIIKIKFKNYINVLEHDIVIRIWIW